MAMKCKMYKTAIMLLLQIILIFISDTVGVNESMAAKLYEFALSNSISKDGIQREVANVSNRIHCASMCLAEPMCKGFGFDKDKTCYLLSVYMASDYCQQNDCLEIQGIMVFMPKEDLTTTTTEVPTTTTTTAPTTTESTTTEEATTMTEAPTTSTTTEPTTMTTKPTSTTAPTKTTTERTTEPLTTITEPKMTTAEITTSKPTATSAENAEIVNVGCNGDTDALQGFVAESTFFNGKVESIICKKKQPDFYPGKEVTKTYSADTNANCDSGYVVSKIAFTILGGSLTEFSVTCKEVKKDYIKLGGVKNVNSNDGKNVNCGDDHAPFTIKPLSSSTEDGVVYDFVTTCQEFQDPEVPGSGGLAG